ncbi:hypothetical protein LX69_01934 [Breznakibacter xylanolyticus]|uniref:Uncharacterized protein n=1 Tax=Breznakibacter xylanolyticus TaxID=990 RepID=A0A2W7Q442_9BACT|nr:hypothetical protein [Breznakibacter xylanolyticus]PZX16439.1 hypothetical protein LX69_01934 [Breznakibacter xylanolyticus]
MKLTAYNGANNVSVEFLDVNSGWMNFKITVGKQTFENRFSNVFDPILELKAWLEAISLGVKQCSFDFDNEGNEFKFDYSRLGYNRFVFTVSECYEDKIHITDWVDPKQLVKAFYYGFLNFVDSEVYQFYEWEEYSYKSKLQDLLQIKGKQLIDHLMSLSTIEFQNLIFSLNPHFSYDFPGVTDKEELKKLNIKYVINDNILPEDIKMVKTPIYDFMPLNYEVMSIEEQLRFVSDILKTVNGQYGANVKKFKSSIIEKYLKTK